MEQNDNPDGLKVLRELIEGEKAGAYQKFHGDDFPEKWARRQVGKSARRSRLKPLMVRLAGVLSVLLVMMIGRWLFLEEKGSPDHSLIDAKTVESLPGNAPWQTRILERRVEKALQACLGGRKWGGRPQSPGKASPASAPEMIEKEKIRTRLFAEIIAKLKEV